VDAAKTVTLSAIIGTTSYQTAITVGLRCYRNSKRLPP
jgi:uncharacterized protein YciW